MEAVLILVYNKDIVLLVQFVQSYKTAECCHVLIVMMAGSSSLNNSIL